MPYQCSANAAISFCNLNAKIELHRTCEPGLILFAWLEPVLLYCAFREEKKNQDFLLAAVNTQQNRWCSWKAMHDAAHWRVTSTGTFSSQLYQYECPAKKGQSHGDS